MDGLTQAAVRVADWIEAHPAGAMAAALPASWVVALVVHALLRVVVARIAVRTASKLDDDLLELVRRPLLWGIMAVGLGYAIGGFDLDEDAQAWLRGFTRSVIVVLTTLTAMRGVHVVLVHLAPETDDEGLIQRRTLPLFDLVGKALVAAFGGWLLLVAWDIDVSAWVASAGVLGIVVGLAAQESLANLVAGISIVSDAPYHIGDVLQFEDGVVARVTRITMRSTRVVTPQDHEIIIPNSVMGKARIINLTAGPRRSARTDVPVCVAYGTDLTRASKVLTDAMAGLEGIEHDDPAAMPAVRVKALESSGVVLTVQVWLLDPWRVVAIVSAVNLRAYDALRAAGIEIPYPKHDVFVKSLPDGRSGVHP